MIVFLVLFILFFGASIWLAKDLLIEKVINYNHGWRETSDFERPENGKLLIVATWYDYWNFDVGYYIEETDEFQSLMVPKNELEKGRYPFEDVEKWKLIDEPNLND